MTKYPRTQIPKEVRSLNDEGGFAMTKYLRTQIPKEVRNLNDEGLVEGLELWALVAWFFGE